MRNPQADSTMLCCVWSCVFLHEWFVSSGCSDWTTPILHIRVFFGITTLEGKAKKSTKTINGQSDAVCFDSKVFNPKPRLTGIVGLTWLALRVWVSQKEHITKWPGQTTKLPPWPFPARPPQSTSSNLTLVKGANTTCSDECYSTLAWVADLRRRHSFGQSKTSKGGPFTPRVCRRPFYPKQQPPENCNKTPDHWTHKNLVILLQLSPAEFHGQFPWWCVAIFWHQVLWHAIWPM